MFQSDYDHSRIKETISALKRIQNLRCRLYNENLNKIEKVLISPYRILENASLFRKLWSSKNSDILWVDYAELVVTTRCTLCCKECSALIPRYPQHTDMPYDLLARTLERYFEAIDYVYIFRVLGGEPLLFPDLNQLIKKLVGFKGKIGHIEIVTNGTLPIKDAGLLSTVVDNNISFDISNYPQSNKHLIDQLQENKVSYRQVENQIWFDWGDLKCRNLPPDKLDRRFIQCQAFCKSILNGKLYWCCRSSHGHNLKLLPDTPTDYVDLLDESLSLSSLRSQLKSMYERTSHIEACNHCNGGTDSIKILPPAEQ